jgi:hypothetical protein
MNFRILVNVADFAAPARDASASIFLDPRTHVYAGAGKYERKIT